MASPKRESWTTAEIIVARKLVPEGLVLLRKVQRKGPTRTGYTGFWNYGSWLIHSGCLFDLADPGADGTLVQHGWNWSTGELTTDYREALQEGALHPWICFPLTAGRTWRGTDPDFSSRVEGTRDSTAFTLSFPLSKWSENATRVREFNIQGWAYVWFREGVGITDLRYSHSGAFGEYLVTLEEFRPR